MRKIVLFAAAIALVMTVGLGLGYAQTATPGYYAGGWHHPWHYTMSGDRYVSQSPRGWNYPMGGYGHGPGHGMGYGRSFYGGCGGNGWGHGGWGHGGGGYGSR